MPVGPIYVQLRASFKRLNEALCRGYLGFLPDPNSVDISLLGNLPEIMPLCTRVSLWDIPDVIDVLVEAKKRGAGAKEVAKIINIPWVARLVPEDACSVRMLEVVRALPPSTFAQTLPDNPTRVPNWVQLVSACTHKVWMAHNAVKLIEAAGSDAAHSVLDYINSLPSLAKTKDVTVLMEESEVWHEERLLAQEEERRQSMARSVSGLRGRTARLQISDEDGVWENVTVCDMQWPDMEEAYRPIWDMPRRQFSIGVRTWPRGPIVYPFERELPLRSGHLQLVVLTHREEFEEESRRMAHCVGNFDQNYWPHAVEHRHIIASIRHGDVPVVTVQFDVDGSIIQRQGYNNKPWPPEYSYGVGRLCDEFRHMLIRYDGWARNVSSSRNSDMMLIGGPEHGRRIPRPHEYHDRYCVMRRPQAVYRSIDEVIDPLEPVEYDEYRRVTFGGVSYLVHTNLTEEQAWEDYIRHLQRPRVEPQRRDDMVDSMRVLFEARYEIDRLIRRPPPVTDGA